MKVRRNIDLENQKISVEWISSSKSIGESPRRRKSVSYQGLEIKRKLACRLFERVAWSNTAVYQVYRGSWNVMDIVRSIYSRDP